MTVKHVERIAIIGGGPAGSMAAERLARGGARVTVFEERVGWEKPCGGGLPYKALRQYPFLMEAADPHKSIESAELVAANGASVRLRLHHPLVIYSRAVLNALLLRRAQAAGAEVIEDRVLDIAPKSGNGPPSGWRIEGRQGAHRADFLILAAGARSRLRSRFARDFGAGDFMLTFGYYSPVLSDGRDDLLRVEFFDDFEGYAWAFPRPDHLSLGICGKVGESSMAGLRDRLHGFMRKFGYDEGPAPVFSHILPALSPESWNNLKFSGPAWALAGDSAGLVDPVTGEGIYFAMRSGELLAESLLDGVPESYRDRLWCDYGEKLALGARLARYFYHEDFLGKLSSTRLIEFSARSKTFLDLLQDLLDGTQSYAGLAGRLYRTLGLSILEFLGNTVRDSFRRFSVGQGKI